MSDTGDGNSGKWAKLALANAAVGGWLAYDMATATEAPSTALMSLQLMLLAGCLIGLGGALYKLLAKA